MMEIDVRTASQQVEDIEFGVDIVKIKLKEGKIVKLLVIMQEFAKIKKPEFESEKVFEKPEIIEIVKKAA